MIDIETILNKACDILTEEARMTGFKSSPLFEQRVRNVLAALMPDNFGIKVDMSPPAQAFPDGNHQKFCFWMNR